MKKETEEIIKQTLKLKGGRSRPDKSLPFIFSQLKYFKNKNILDIGCGRGMIGKCIKTELSDNNFNIDGIEVYSEYIKESNIGQYYNNIFICNYIEEYKKYIDYDIFLFIDVLEHFEYDRAIEIINHLIDKNKNIFLSIPNAQKHWEQAKSFEEKNSFENHLYDWTNEEVIEKLKLKLVGEYDAIGVFSNI